MIIPGHITASAVQAHALETMLAQLARVKELEQTLVDLLGQIQEERARLVEFAERTDEANRTLDGFLASQKIATHREGWFSAPEPGRMSA